MGNQEEDGEEGKDFRKKGKMDAGKQQKRGRFREKGKILDGRGR